MHNSSRCRLFGLGQGGEKLKVAPCHNPVTLPRRGLAYRAGGDQHAAGALRHVGAQFLKPLPKRWLGQAALRGACADPS
jgi:hypothetical protein